MKTVEVRRASLRVKPHKGLSETGVKLAQELAPYLGGSYHAYYSSPARRSRETMEALGFPTYRRLEVFGALPDTFDRFEVELLARQRESGCSFFEGYLTIPAARERLLRLGARLLKAVRRLSRKVQPGARVLVISHSGIVEALALAAREELSTAFIGGELKQLEGIAVELEDDLVRQVRILRLPGEILTAFSTGHETADGTRP